MGKYEELQNRVKAMEAAEGERVSCDLYRLGFHLMPPVGWLNDPNGLCQFQGKYHVFFQYSPEDAAGGGMKAWGHYVSEDMLHWSYAGTPLVPDKDYDVNGVYSGSAFVEAGVMHIFYTGNVKEPGDHDYTHSGRRADVVHVTSVDGMTFSEKQVVIATGDFPQGYTCHIRDPKVWKEADSYYMVLGARADADKGEVLLYTSKDLVHWSFVKSITTQDTFGYMWECPDAFILDDRQLLSVSPQGLPEQPYCWQNNYQSGYFFVEGDWKRNVYSLSQFKEWDMGFDFYAPQTFEDEKGRRILYGWMGLPDMDKEYVNPTVKSGWQFALTVPRELSIEQGTVKQYPVAELNQLRSEKIEITPDRTCNILNNFDMVLTDLTGDCEVTVCGSLKLRYEGDCLTMEFSDTKLGGRRTVRRARLSKLTELRILADSSCIEVYANGGEVVMTTRYFPEIAEGKLIRSIRVHVEDKKHSPGIVCYTMNDMFVSY